MSAEKEPYSKRSRKLERNDKAWKKRPLPPSSRKCPKETRTKKKHRTQELAEFEREACPNLLSTRNAYEATQELLRRKTRKSKAPEGGRRLTRSQLVAEKQTN